MQRTKLGFSALVLGAYDPVSGAIRLPYEVRTGRDIFRNPHAVHELAHHGQTLLTHAGIEYLTSLFNLVQCTRAIVANAGSLVLPLHSTPPDDRGSHAWEKAELSHRILREFVGGVSSTKLLAFRRKMKQYGGSLFRSAFVPSSSESPVRLRGVFDVDLVPSQGAPPGEPTIEVDLDNGDRLSFALDGNFVFELHARLIQAIVYREMAGLTPYGEIEHFQT